VYYMCWGVVRCVIKSAYSIDHILRYRHLCFFFFMLSLVDEDWACIVGKCEGVVACA
jgi:hypothetical protein